MNRRNSKKIVIAPKIPVEDKVERIPVVKKEKEIVEEKKVVQRMKGLFIPQQFDSFGNFNYEKDNFILSLQDEKNLSLVLFEDGSVGFRRNGKLLDFDILSIGNSMVVNVSKEIKKLKKINFIVNCYDE